MHSSSISPDAIDWFRKQLFACFAHISDPQISDKTWFTLEDTRISYGALLYALAAVHRGNNDKYSISLALDRCHDQLALVLADPNTDLAAWGRKGSEDKAQLERVPWQVWVDATFDVMDSKAALPKREWSWFDVQFAVIDLFSFFPAPNVYLMGRQIDLSNQTRGELEITEVVTLLGIGRAICSDELGGADVMPVPILTYPESIDTELCFILNAARDGELIVYGNSSAGIGEENWIDANQKVPTEAFGRGCSYNLEYNILNFQGGKSGVEREFSNLTIRAKDLYALLVGRGRVAEPEEASSGLISVGEPQLLGETSRQTGLPEGRPPTQSSSAENALIELYGSVRKPDGETLLSITATINQYLRENKKPVVSESTVKRVLRRASYKNGSAKTPSDPF